MKMATHMRVIRRRLILKSLAINALILIFGIYVGESVILLHNKAHQYDYMTGDL